MFLIFFFSKIYDQSNSCCNWPLHLFFDKRIMLRDCTFLNIHLTSSHNSEMELHMKNFIFQMIILQMHIIGYNSEVYKTMDEAVNGVRGLVAIAVFIEVMKKICFFFLNCILEILNSVRPNRHQLSESQYSTSSLSFDLN